MKSCSLTVWVNHHQTNFFYCIAVWNLIWAQWITTVRPSAVISRIFADSIMLACRNALTNARAKRKSEKCMHKKSGLTMSDAMKWNSKAIHNENIPHRLVLIANSRLREWIRLKTVCREILLFALEFFEEEKSHSEMIRKYLKKSFQP